MATSEWKSCGRKKRYGSRGEANTALKSIRRAGKARQGRRVAVRAYHCEHCDGWHLTHRPSWDDSDPTFSGSF